VKVSAVVVTRGDVTIKPIIERICDTSPSVDEILVWSNGIALRRYWAGPPGSFEIVRQPIPDLAVYGRYAAIEYAKHDWIYVQDDDALVDAEAVIGRAGQLPVVANMPRSRWRDYPDSALLGWGAVFERGLPQVAFGRFSGMRGTGPADPSLFLRECDTVFSTLTPTLKIDIGFAHLPWAEGPGRMFTEDPERHRRERQEMLGLARQVRDA
jgi:hypothetical protein